MAYHHTLVAGTRIASYEIRDVLGAGGFGVTYRAYDTSLDRVVAIKEYLPTGLAVRIADGTTVAPKSQGDAQDFEYGLKRFLDEARTLARFREPNIVRVISYLEAHGTAYFVMDYEDGESLIERLQTSITLPEEAIRAIVLPILSGLRAVHQQNFLHRDIKPHNIYLRRDGSPVLLDFGAARQDLGEHSRAMTGMVSPGYAPFEQYLTSGQGPWSDIYALGATMYHCATGIAPVAATERVAAIHEGKPDPLTAVSGLLSERYSPGFLKALTWMLAPMHKDRPQSVTAAMAAFTGEAVATFAPAVGVEHVDVEALGAPPRWQPETLKAVELNLEQHIGPMSRVLVDKAAGRTLNVEQLTQLLSRFIPTEDGKTEFLARTRLLTRGGEQARPTPARPRATPRPARAKKAKAAAPALGAEVMALAERKLVNYVGPMAKVLVRRISEQARDPESFYRLLALELTTPEQRSAFLKDVGGG
jgi:serine/threonine protein kinase